MLKDENVVVGHSIQDVWRDMLWLCVKNGWDFVVKHGSYEGQIRKQLPYFVGVIKEPWLRPLSPIMPPGIPGPTNDEKIENYFAKYLMDDSKDKNEQYTYGEFIVQQIDKVIDMLAISNGNTNQACISVGNENSVNQDDPPCLRTISFKVIEGRLVMSVFFRSWDAYAGFPENIGGLQILKEYVLSQLKVFIEIEDGEIICYSDGLHIYDQYFETVDMLNVDKIKVSAEALRDKEKFNS
jgi:thymidylate synthase